MSTYGSPSPSDQAAAYERYLRENWDSLPSFEQEQAKSWMQAKALAATQTAYQYDSLSYGYLGNALGNLPTSKKSNTDSEWAVPVGYIAIFVFMPLALICAVLNLMNDRIGHGLAQLLIPVALLILLMAQMARM